MAEKPRSSSQVDIDCNSMPWPVRDICEGYKEHVSTSIDAGLMNCKDRLFDDPSFYQEVPGGEYTESEKEKRIQTLKNGEVIFQDAGLKFYQVRSGDSLSKIKAGLEKYPEFSYLSAYKHGSSISCFNIDNAQLKVGMWLPIPLAEKDRTFPESEFSSYCYMALSALRDHDEYAAGVKTILEKVSVKELVASMMAVAKTEAGDEPIGKFALHRYEPHKKAFSYTLFHVLDASEGKRARQKLNMTVGQAIHPRNSAMLFLAYLCEKTLGDPGQYFPIPGQEGKFASLYNGNWQKSNKDYPQRLTRNYASSFAAVSGVKFTSLDYSHAKTPPHVLDARRGVRTTSQDELWKDADKYYYYDFRDHWDSYYKYIRYANNKNSELAGLNPGTTFMVKDSTVAKFAESVARQTKKKCPSKGDRVTVGRDENGVFVGVVSNGTFAKYYYEA